MIELQTNNKFSIIYGALPPDTRKQQANAFNNGENSSIAYY